MELLKVATVYATDLFQSASNISVGVAVTCLVLGCIIAVVRYLIVRDNGVPPGPTGVPILGWWPFIDSARLPLQQIDLKNKYGDIFSYRITGTLYINLTNMKLLKEAHINKTDFFSDRTPEFNVQILIFGEGILFSRGEKWLTVRKYFLSQFRERGMSLFKENTAYTADEIATSLVEDLRKYAVDEPVDILKVLISKGNMMIRNTLLGYGTPVTEEEIHTIQNEYRQVSNLLHSKNMLLIGNFARYFIMPFLPFYKESMKIHGRVRGRLQKIIDDHKRTFDSDHIRDIIDCYIHERNCRKAKGDETYKYFTDKALVYNLLQFIGDGIMSVATFATFVLMTLLDHPEEQDKIYKELTEVCGEDRNATMADKSKLSYFNAFLFEAQRTTNFVPLFPSMECTKETTIGGYRIPKGAITVTNVYSIHNDPNVYENPEKFNPSRFLGVDGKPREELPITFGVGKRTCLGEGFVQMQVFIYMAAIVKNFKLTYHVPKTNFEVAMSRTLEVCVTPRK